MKLSKEQIEELKNKHEAGDHGFMYYIKKEDYRVKLLDREDIEGFGFKQDSYDSFSKEYVSLELDEDQLVRIDERKSEFNHRLFSGTIRNRSELKRILTQIGVI